MILDVLKNSNRDMTSLVKWRRIVSKKHTIARFPSPPITEFIQVLDSVLHVGKGTAEQIHVSAIVGYERRKGAIS